MRTIKQRFRAHQAAKAALQRPRLPVVPPGPADDVPPLPTRADWPAIQSRHPAWWQVHRVELCGDERRHVLIAETRTEDQAFAVMAQQVSQVRITKFSVHERPYYSAAAPLRRDRADPDAGGLRLRDGSTGE